MQLFVSYHETRLNKYPKIIAGRMAGSIMEKLFYQ
jgi:hypothetical protein